MMQSLKVSGIYCHMYWYSYYHASIIISSMLRMQDWSLLVQRLSGQYM